jgi:hypothetical protein
VARIRDRRFDEHLRRLQLQRRLRHQTKKRMLTKLYNERVKSDSTLASDRLVATKLAFAGVSAAGDPGEPPRRKRNEAAA